MDPDQGAVGQHSLSQEDLVGVIGELSVSDHENATDDVSQIGISGEGAAGESVAAEGENTVIGEEATLVGNLANSVGHQSTPVGDLSIIIGQQALQLGVHQPVPDPSIPLKPNSLRKLPAEIRQKILTKSGTSLDILRGFQGDNIVYQDALKTHFDNRRFYFPLEKESRQHLLFSDPSVHDNSYNLVEECPLSQNSLHSIKKLDLVLLRHQKWGALANIRNDREFLKSTYHMGALTTLCNKVTDLRLILEDRINHQAGPAVNIPQPIAPLAAALHAFLGHNNISNIPPTVPSQNGGWQFIHPFQFGPPLPQFGPPLPHVVTERIEGATATTIVLRTLDCVAAFGKNGGLSVFSIEFEPGTLKALMNGAHGKISAIDELNRAFGLDAKLYEVRSDGTATYFWKAPKGKKLNWFVNPDGRRIPATGVRLAPMEMSPHWLVNPALSSYDRTAAP